MTWHSVIARFTSNAEDHFDRLKYRFGTRLGGRDPLQILPYLGYGTPQRLYLKGRVLEDEGVLSAQENDTLWNNLVGMYRRFASDEIPGAVVEARLPGQTQQVITDDEGFFDLWMTPTQSLSPQQSWHNVALTLLSPRRHDQAVSAVGRVLVPPARARFGVISDIDDTIVHTDAANLLKMARIVFLGNAHTRLPFAGDLGFLSRPSKTDTAGTR